MIVSLALNAGTVPGLAAAGIGTGTDACDFVPSIRETICSFWGRAAVYACAGFSLPVDASLPPAAAALVA